MAAAETRTGRPTPDSPTPGRTVRNTVAEPYAISLPTRSTRRGRRTHRPLTPPALACGGGETGVARGRGGAARVAAGRLRDLPGQRSAGLEGEAGERRRARRTAGRPATQHPTAAPRAGRQPGR